MLDDVLAVGASWAGERALTGDSTSVVHVNRKAQASRKRVMEILPIYTIEVDNLTRFEERGSEDQRTALQFCTAVCRSAHSSRYRTAKGEADSNGGLVY